MAKKAKSKRVTRDKLLTSIWQQLEELDAQMTSGWVEELPTNELKFVKTRLDDALKRTNAYFIHLFSALRSQLVKPVKRKQAARRRG